MTKRVDVAIIGAGSAGLSALKEVRKVTQNFVVIDGGPLGTTCAREGCMPSKTLIQAANDYHGYRLLGRGKKPPITVPAILRHVRALRDGFAGAVARSTRRLGERLVRGRAVFESPHELRVEGSVYRAERVILATGSRPTVPDEWLLLGSRVVTTDDLFELETLPKRVGVVGLGAVGLEMGQALSRMGCDVAAFDRSGGVGILTDPAVNAYAARRFAKEFPIHFGGEVELKARSKKVLVAAGGKDLERDLVLASMGRRPNIDYLGLATIGAPLNQSGFLEFDRETMKLPDLPVYLAGDVGARRPIQHEASDDGRIAGYNSVRRTPRRFPRRAALAITFSDPNLAVVGKSFADLKGVRFVTGAANFETQARALIMGENFGLLHVYAGKSDGRLLGAEMVGPGGEHLAHLLAWSLQRGLTVFEMLRLPFYHPVIEEGLRDALRDAAGQIKVRSTTLSSTHFSE